MPLATKGKGKGRGEPRRSRSRNTTPSSVISSGTAPLIPSSTPFLDVDTAKLIVPGNPSFSDVLDRLPTGSHILEPKQIDSIIDSLKTLSSLVETRSTICEQAIRKLVERKKDVAEEQREYERIEKEEHRRFQAKKGAGDDDERGRKSAKVKKRKERSGTRGDGEDRPLAHGAHGVAKQDGSDIKEEGKSDQIIVAIAYLAGISAVAIASSLSATRKSGYATM